MEIIHKSHKVKTPEELKEYYRTWSSTYDTDVSECNYNGPKTIFNILTQRFNIYGSRILDVGCGTGLIADYLNADKYQLTIDGIDISQEMLDIASKRNYYNEVSIVNVLNISNPQSKKYDFIVSAGMFTHNHVGPEAVENIINFLDIDGVFIFTVRNSFAVKTNFDDYIVDLVHRGKIKKSSKLDDQSYIDEEKCSVYSLFV
jgi:predicted TPR repeat methyltransferase